MRFLLLLQSTSNFTNVPSPVPDYGRLVYSIVAFVFVLVLAYLSTKLLAVYRRAGRGKGNIEIIESVHIAHQNSVTLVKMGEKYIFLGVTKENISYLSEMDESMLKEQEHNNLSKISFESYLKSFLKNKRDE